MKNWEKKKTTCVKQMQLTIASQLNWMRMLKKQHSYRMFCYAYGIFIVYRCLCMGGYTATMKVVET